MFSNYALLGICQGPYKATDCCIAEIRKRSFFSSLFGSVLDINVKWNTKYLKDPKSSLYFMQLKNTKHETEPCRCKTWKNQNGRATGKLKDATSLLQGTRYYGGPWVSRQNQKPRGKTKNLTAKPKTSRQNQMPQGKTKYLHGKTKYLHGKSKNSTAKPNRAFSLFFLKDRARLLERRSHFRRSTVWFCRDTHGTSSYRYVVV